MIRFNSVLAVAVVAASLAVSCGKSDSDGGKVSIRFSNAQNSPVSFSLSSMLSRPEGVQTLATGAPTTFKMMLIAAYLTENIDATTGANQGNTSMVYLNPECGDDIMHCDISAGTAEDGASLSHVLSTFFDFAQSSTTVNAALNAQGRTITAGTYRYARLEFCKYNSGNADNIKWASTAEGVSERSFKRNSCTVNSQAFATPIEVAEGDSVTVTLSYDYSSSVTTGASASGDDCTNPGNASNVCFTLPTFVPTASK